LATLRRFYGLDHLGKSGSFAEIDNRIAFYKWQPNYQDLISLKNQQDFDD
jgi:hypothetical protein